MNNEELRPLPPEGLNEQEAIQLGIDLCGTLEPMDPDRVSRTQISPDNIMRSPDGGFVLKDAGTDSRPAVHDTVPDGGLSIYTAPELFGGGEPSAACRIYSLGMTMCTLVNGGRPLFELDEDDPESSVPSRLPDITGISYSFMRILRRMCASDPAARYGTAGQCMTELSLLLKRQRDDEEKGRNPVSQDNGQLPDEPVGTVTAEPVPSPDNIPGGEDDADGFDPEYSAPGYDEPDYGGSETSDSEQYGESGYDADVEPVHYAKRVILTSVIIILLFAGLLSAAAVLWPRREREDSDGITAHIQPETTAHVPSNSENYIYHGIMSDRGITIDMYIGNEKNVTVPDNIGGVPVTSIGSSAFTGSSVESIVIQEGITEICGAAFSGCSKLQSVQLPQTVQTVGDSAFSGCTSLETVDIPEGVLTLGGSAFSGCISLREVSLPSTLGKIGPEAFRSCPELGKVSVAPGNTSFETDAAGVLYSKDRSILILCPAKTSFSSIGGVYELSPEVHSIKAYAFSHVDGLDSIVMTEKRFSSETDSGVLRIEPNAFLYCSSLKSVRISSHVTSIGDDAFKFCKSLGSILVSRDNKYYSSDPAGVLFNKDKTVLIRYPQAGSSVNYSVPDSVEKIYNCAFTSCGQLRSVVLPDSLTEIGSYAFDDCVSLEDLMLPDSLVSIRSYAFANCRSLSSLIIPDSVEEIGSGAFTRCRITVFAPCEAERYGGAPYDSAQDTEIAWNVMSYPAQPPEFD